MFKARNKPFVLVFWSRDPDGSQHNNGDSLNTVTPGINGPTSMAGIKNADDNLAQLRKALDELGLAATTDIIISADHGFSTISKESKTSPSAKVSYDDTPKDFLPMGFLALDLAKALDLPLFDPNDKNAAVGEGKHPKAGNGVLGKDPAKPDLVVATNGGSDLIYLPNKDKKLAEAHRQGAAGAGLCQRPLRRRRARQVPRHPADVADQPEGQGGDADAVDRRQLPHLCQRDARSRPIARSRSPTPCCGRARACMAASAAATP